MEVLFHFLFIIVKIAILASIYSFTLIMLITAVGEIKSFPFYNRLKKERTKYWFGFGFIISVLLFLFTYTYYGNHGLGDSARIPIGNWKTIENINWDGYGTFANHYTHGGQKIITTKFKVKNDILCGNYESWFYEYNNDYFIYYLHTNEHIEFESEEEYNLYARTHNLPDSFALLSFEENYKNYWDGFRFILFP